MKVDLSREDALCRTNLVFGVNPIGTRLKKKA